MSGFEIVPAGPREEDWLYSLHKLTLGPYVTKTFGWDETLQRRSFAERSARNNDFLVMIDDTRVGMISFTEDDTCIRLLRIEIHPDHQRKGIGTQVIRHLIDSAKRLNKTIQLRVFTINPAKALYHRLGFVVTQETETHYYMEWRNPEGAS